MCPSPAPSPRLSTGAALAWLTACEAWEVDPSKVRLGKGLLECQEGGEVEGAGRSPPRLLSWHVTLAAELPSLGLSLPLVKRDCAHPLTRKRGVPPGPHSPLCSGGGGPPREDQRAPHQPASVGGEGWDQVRRCHGDELACFLHFQSWEGVNPDLQTGQTASSRAEGQRGVGS